MTYTEVMTVREVAEYLKVKDRTIYRLVANGEMPGFKVGGSWRFRKSEIDQWTTANSVGPVKPGKRVEMKLMTVPTIFETCRPREDVLKGAITEADFAADLAQVIVGDGGMKNISTRHVSSPTPIPLEASGTCSPT